MKIAPATSYPSNMFMIGKRCLMSDSVFTYLNNVMAEELGFEPRRQFPDLPVFKTGPFNHLGIPPKYSFILVDPVGLEPTTDRL